MNSDYDKFPAKIYSKTVLEPDFEIYKSYFYENLFDINISHAIMLFEQKILNKKETSKILSSLFLIHSNKSILNKNYDGTFEDLFFLVEQELTKNIGLDIAGKLHTGRSRNDMEHTMFRMQLRLKLINLLNNFSNLCDNLILRIKKGINEPVLLYTHGQPAQVSVFGHYLSAILEFVLRDMKRILYSLTEVNNCPMGSAAITTSGFNLSRKRISQLLGFDDIVENSYGAIANCDYITSAYSSVRLSCIHLGRFVQDLLYWTSFEVSQLDVPNGFVQISSIMPQKRNPVPLEHLRLKLSLASGNAEQIISTMHNTPFADMNDSERETQATGYKVFEKLQEILPLLSEFINSTKINKESVKNRVNSSLATITELADTLVRKEKVSFRIAHSISHEIAKKSTKLKKPLDKLNVKIVRDVFYKHVGRTLKLKDDDLKKSFTLENFVNVRNLEGGPAKSALKKSIVKYENELHTLNKKIKIIKKSIDNAKSTRLKLGIEFSNNGSL